MIHTSRFFYLLTVLVLTAGTASAQGPATGTPPFGYFGGGPDIINLANLNAHITIPILHKPGRGTNFTYDIGYDSSVWVPVTSGSTTSWLPVNGTWGWQGLAAAGASYIAYSMTYLPGTCYNGGPVSYQEWQFSNFVYHDPFGVAHSFDLGTPVFFQSPGGSNCPPNGPQPATTPWTATATDGSGYKLQITPGAGFVSGNVVASNGSIITPTITSNPSGQQGFYSSTDRNGNKITSSNGVYTDTLGTTALTVSGTAPSNTTFTYTPPAGGSAIYTMSYAAYTVATNFAISGINEKGATATNLVDKVTLPDGSFYQFKYEQTPSTPVTGACTPVTGTYQSYCVTARIHQVTLPTGGTITYTYTGGAGTNGSGIFSDGSAATLQRVLTDGGSWSATWNYSRTQMSGPHWQTTITDPTTPTANQTVIDFQKDSATNPTQNFYETQRQVYQGSTSGTLLQTITTCYNGNTASCTTTTVSSPITRRTQTIQLGSLQCKHDLFWNSFGMLTEADDYDYASGAPGPLLQQTLITPASLGSNLNAFTQSVTVKDGSGTIKSRQDTTYDQYGSSMVCVTGAPQHDDSGQGCSFTARANATSVTTYTNPAGPSGGIAQNFTYDSLGNLRTATDALNHATTLAYSPDAWANTACPPSATTYAFPVSASNALSQTTSFTYFACSGQLASVKDPNNQTTSVSYDSLLRPTQQNFADGGQTTWTYNSQTSIQTQIKMNTTPQYITSTLLLDGLGRSKQTQLNSDPQGVDYTDTTYDVVGRVVSVSNPYRSTTDATYGLTSYQYDALSRPTLVIPPDGTSSANNISTTYTNNVTTVTDQAGKKRQTTADALGRLTQVTEDPGGLAYVTTYSYDTLSNLISVVQNGSRQRTYTYDALSRLVCESNPEIQIATCPNPDNGSYTAGTVRYGYDNNNNLTGRQAPAPNQTGTATVTTTYSYDALHRLTQKSYNDGATPTANYYYDQPAPWGWNLSNYIGRLTEETTSLSGSGLTDAMFNYDPVGRVTNYGECTPLNCTGPNGAFHVLYTYDLVGHATSLPVSYGSNLSYTTSYAYDAAGRPSGVTSNLVDAQHPATLATVDSSVGYYPTGAIRKMNYGNGLAATAAFNNVLEPCRINLNSSAATLGACADAIPSGNLLDLGYGFNAGTTNNGNVASWSATGQQSFNRSYTYDSLNRIATLADSASGQACKGLSWTYDAWGNRTDQTVTSGTCNTFHQAVNTQNHIAGAPYQYDAAGNLVADGNHTYTYDAENRLTQIDGGNAVTYVYNAEGHRVRRALTTGQNTDHILDVNGNVVTEWNSGGTWGTPGFWGEGYVYLGTQQLAHYHGGTTLFVHQDHLGSTRLQTDLSKNVQVSYDYLPFGETIQSGSGNWYEFAGNERDYGLDRTWFRQYSSSLARWTSPDPAGIAAVDPTNPQSWNRYGYVNNNPLNSVDPLGLWFVDCSWDGCPSSQGGGGGGGDYSGSIGPQGIVNYGWVWDQHVQMENAWYASGSIPGYTVTNGHLRRFIPGGTEFDPNRNWDPNDPNSQAGIFHTSTDYWLDLGLIDGGNTSDNWWGTFGSTFLNGVLHGDRQQGESFKACVLRNADETTFGAHKAVIGAVVATASAAIANASRVQISGGATVSGTANIALYAGRFVFLASGGFISGTTVIRPVAYAIGFAGRAAPYVAAAEAGLLIGSAINCR